MRLCMIHQYTSIIYKCLKVHASYFSFFFCITIGANGVLSVQALFCGLGLGWTTTTVVVTVRSRLIVWWDQAVAPFPFFPSVCFWPRVVLPSMKGGSLHGQGGFIEGMKRSCEYRAACAVRVALFRGIATSDNVVDCTEFRR